MRVPNRTMLPPCSPTHDHGNSRDVGRVPFATSSPVRHDTVTDAECPRHTAKICTGSRFLTDLLPVMFPWNFTPVPVFARAAE